LFGYALLLGVALGMALPTADAIASRSAEVAGAKPRYLTAGNEPAVLLLHGYTQTSRILTDPCDT
jgi:hypothetical protein